MPRCLVVYPTDENVQPQITDTMYRSDQNESTPQQDETTKHKENKRTHPLKRSSFIESIAQKLGKHTAKNKDLSQKVDGLRNQVEQFGSCRQGTGL